ncbi:hypothetical protein [Proteus mirabilis]|uniref:hypothetical protein n=1 Tax=Proteus mirabilis TaxID=584 RepID=UPI0024E0C43B|nr:hypothetical protein [Proteus mirabilis]
MNNPLFGAIHVVRLTTVCRTVVFCPKTMAGLASAKARGRSSGRRPVMTPAKLNRAQQLMSKGATVREAAAAIKVGKTALYDALRAQGDDGAMNGD